MARSARATDRRAKTFLPNVNAWQVRAGNVIVVALAVGGLAFGLWSASRGGSSTAVAQFAAGVLLGLIAAAAYAFAAAAGRSSFFVDDQAEVDRTMSIRSRMPFASAVGAGLVLAGATAAIRAEFGFVVGGVFCGVLLAWAPIMLAAWVRFERRRAAS